jgi:hypothetical protein
MKRSVTGLLLLMLTISLVQSEGIGSPLPSGQPPELEQLSKEWMDAMLRHDKPKLEELLASEYVLRNWDGSAPETPRAAWLDNLFKHLKIDRWEQSAISARVYGDVGVVTSLYSWAGTFHGKPFDSKGFLTDVWLRRNQRWQVVSRTSGPIPGSKTL